MVTFDGDVTVGDVVINGQIIASKEDFDRVVEQVIAMRPLVAKVREALGEAKERLQARGHNFGAEQAAKAIAEADKFLGKGE